MEQMTSQLVNDSPERPTPSEQTAPQPQRRHALIGIASLIIQRLAFGALVLVTITFLSHLGLGMAQGTAFQPALARAASKTVTYLQRLAHGNLGLSAAGSVTLRPVPIAEVLPATLSRSLGLLAAALLIATIVGVALLPLVGSAAVWVIVIIIGVARDGFMAVALTISTETEGGGVVYAGTAMGLTQTIMNVGPLSAPALGNSLADPANPSAPYPFFLWAAFGLLALVAFCFVKETGWGNKPRL